MSLTIPKEAPLYRPEDLTEAELALVNSYKRNTFTVLDGNTIARSNSGFFITTNIVSSWRHCLEAVMEYNASSTVYLYFPSAFLSCEEVAKYCGFLKNYLNQGVKYLGECWLSTATYYAMAPDQQVRSHIIAMHNEGKQYVDCKYSILAKVTMLRYCYRHSHFEYLIAPMYEMVEAGLNPWDALMLAHYYSENFQSHYVSGRGLLVSVHSPTLHWPRSHKEMMASLKDNYLLHATWGGKVGTASQLFHCGNIQESVYGCNNKWSKVESFMEELRLLFAQKKYKGAWALYRDWCKQFIPFLKAVEKDYNGYLQLTKGPRFCFYYSDGTKYGVGCVTDLINHLESL